MGIINLSSEWFSCIVINNVKQTFCGQKLVILGTVPQTQKTNIAYCLLIIRQAYFFRVLFIFLSVYEIFFLLIFVINKKAYVRAKHQMHNNIFMQCESENAFYKTITTFTSLK